MLAVAQHLETPAKAYGLVLGGMMAAAFVAGGAMNYAYAVKNPGADPYRPAPAVEAVAAPEPPPAILLIPAQPAPADEGETAAVVAVRHRASPAIARREPTHCVDQAAPDGRHLGRLCTPDPGGVKASATGAIKR